MVLGETGEDMINGHDVEVLDGPQALHRAEQPDERHANFLVRVVDQVRNTLQARSAQFFGRRAGTRNNVLTKYQRQIPAII